MMDPEEKAEPLASYSYDPETDTETGVPAEAPSGDVPGYVDEYGADNVWDTAGGIDPTAEGAEPEEPEPEEEPPRRFSLLFELEYLAASARRGAYETIKTIFDSKGIEFGPVHFNRFSSCARPEHYVDDLLTLCNARKLSNNKLINDIKSGVAEYLATIPANLDPTLAKIIDTAREKEMIVAAVTSLPQAVFSNFATKLGLDDRGVQIFSFPEADKHFPKADSWLKVCKEIEVKPVSAVALVTTNVACKGALTAGMRVIAVPDEFTNYQDFGGAYSVLGQLDDIEMDDLFSILPDPEEEDDAGK